MSISPPDSPDPGSGSPQPVERSVERPGEGLEVVEYTQVSQEWRAFIDDEPDEEAARRAAERADVEARIQRHDVTAVLISHDGARWLPYALSALADLERAPRRVIAIDTGSTDATLDLLTGSIGAASVLSMPTTTGYGTAVARAVSALSGAPGLPSSPGGNEVVEWLWLLHDDCAPAPGALREQLIVAEQNPTAGVVGAKIRGWRHGRLLLELGVTVGRSGRRETGLEPGESDQGQHDDRRDVLAVGSAGMLVRRDVWDALGGFSEDLPMFRDDVDFCWRARRAGFGVVVAPDAVVHHAEAAAHGRRPLAVGGVTAHGADRRSALLLLLANLPRRAMPWAYVRLTIGSLVRTLALVLGKAPQDALAEVRALGATVARPDRIYRARTRRAPTITEPWSSLRPLLAPSGVHLRRGLEALVAGAAATSDSSSTGGGSLESGPGDEAGDSMTRVGGGGLARLLRRPAAVVSLALVAVSVLAWRGLALGGPLQGGALLPAPEGATDLWQRYAEAWHPVGVGSSAPAPPWLAILSGASAVTLGRPGLLVSLLFVLAAPLAGASAYLLLRRLTASMRLRVWGSAAYALLPAVTGAVSGGHLGSVVVVWMLPLLVLALGRLGPPHEDTTPIHRPIHRPIHSWRAVAATGLLLAVVASFVPMAWAAVAVSMVAWGVGAAPVRSAMRPWWLRALVLLGIPVVLLLPWSWQLITHPSRLLLEPGAQSFGLADPDLPTWALALGWPGGPGLPAWWVTAGLAVAGLAALVVGRRRGAVLAALGVALLGLLLGLLTVIQRVDVPSVGTQVTAWPGFATLLVGGGLIAAAVLGSGGLQDSLSRRAFGWRQPVAVLVVAVALLTPAAAAVSWVARGVEGPLNRASADVLPAFVAAAAQSPSHPTTLVLAERRGQPVRFTVLRGAGPTLGDADLAPSAAAAGPLGSVVADLGSGRSGDDVAARLSTYGVGFVLVTRPALSQLTDALDSAPGLERLAASDGSALWGVAGTASRVRVQSADGRAEAVPSGDVAAQADIPAARSMQGSVSARVLALAEAADPGWRASLTGVPLIAMPADQPEILEPPVPAYAGPSASWAQRFALPSAGGSLILDYDATTRSRWLVAEGVLVLVLVVVALPSRRRVEDDEEDDRLDRS